METTTRKKQWLAGILLMALCGALLAGCSDTSSSDNANNDKSGSAKSAAKGVPGSGGSQQAD